MKKLSHEELKALPPRTRFTAVELFGGGESRAITEAGGALFVYAKGRRRYGFRYSLERFEALYEAYIITPEEVDASWKRRIRKAIRLIEKNQVWQSNLTVLKNLLKMSYLDKKEIEKIYWKKWEEPYKSNRALLEAELVPFLTKYDFVFGRDEGGNLTFNTSYLYEMSEVRLKSMNFGRQNAYYKERIKEALLLKKAYSIQRLECGYDVSFEYDPEKGCAWYSEEYRGCGNGHYYIALSENCAWFCEDD